MAWESIIIIKYICLTQIIYNKKIYRELLKMPEDRSESVKTLIMDSSTWRLGEKELSIIQILSGFA